MTHGRRACLNGTTCEPRSIGEAQYCLVNHSMLSVAEIAARVGRSEAYLRKAANPDYDQQSLPVETLLAITHVTGNLIAVRFMARSLGCLLVAVPQADAAGEAIYRAFAQSVQSIGDSGALIERALSNGTIEADECAGIVQRIEGHIEHTAALKECVLRTAQHVHAQKGNAR